MTHIGQYSDLICYLRDEKKYTYNEISMYLENEIGIRSGASARSVKRFCLENTNKIRVSNDDLTAAVTSAIDEVGPTWGRKMTTGYLRSRGVFASERRVGNMLRVINQPYHVMRVQGARNLNTVPYYTSHFGHKLHLDQNEKLVMFGVTHVAATDGRTSKVVGYHTMPIKNNYEIYQHVFRKIYLEYGRMWDQVRVDHGTEFYLTLFMQEVNKEKRWNQTSAAYKQTESKHNLKAERFWPEVNNRFNYPLKEALVHMCNDNVIDMEDTVTRYCTSQICILLSQVGLERIVSGWNAHRIPGVGVPNELAAIHYNGTNISENDFPEASIAANLYSATLGGTLTPESVFERSPFRTLQQQIDCEQEFNREFPNIEFILNSVVNKRPGIFQACLEFLIERTAFHSA